MNYKAVIMILRQKLFFEINKMRINTCKCPTLVIVNNIYDLYFIIYETIVLKIKYIAFCRTICKYKKLDSKLSLSIIFDLNNSLYDRTFNRGMITYEVMIYMYFL